MTHSEHRSHVRLGHAGFTADPRFDSKLRRHISKLTWQVGRYVDLGVEPLVGQQLRHAVQSLHSEGVVGVWEKVDHRHRPLRQANLLRDKAHAGPTRLTLPRHAPLARHAVGQVRPAARVRRRGPLQDQRRLLQGADQVSRWRRGPLRGGGEIIC